MAMIMGQWHHQNLSQLRTPLAHFVDTDTGMNIWMRKFAFECVNVKYFTRMFKDNIELGFPRLKIFMQYECETLYILRTQGRWPHDWGLNPPRQYQDQKF